MPRAVRRVFPGCPVHVIQRGHNRDRCFNSDRDYILYLGLLQEFAARHECPVHAYVLMTNHVHLLMSPDDAESLSSMMRDINQRFVQQVNRNQNRCGSSWQGRFKSCIVDSTSYLLTCQRYIELNPVRARMVKGPWLYPWSSYQINAMGRKSELVTPHPAYLQLGATTELRQAAYRQLFDDEISDEALGKIRMSANGGWPMGPESFAKRVANALGMRAVPGKPGRPLKEKPGQTGV